ncbi:hypothetical protein [Capnocytophaga cynodegmi]|uniref:hypothetical protein n=1 Tax=Capnocytophaga cynodegmi TaxID=28189 RepID=UPI0026B88D83
MKKIILAFVIVFFIFSCKDKKQNEVSVSTIEAKIDTINEEELKKTEITVDTIRKFCTEDFYEIFNTNLIGVEASQETDEETPDYKRYAVDYADVCYSSELMAIKIEKEVITIFNYQYPEKLKKIQIMDCEVINDSLKIRTDSKEISEIIISKIKNVPVFSLTHEGEYVIEISKTERVRVSNFLIKEENLEYFGGIRDCGDFEG